MHLLDKGPPLLVTFVSIVLQYYRQWQPQSAAPVAFFPSHEEQAMTSLRAADSCALEKRRGAARFGCCQ
jgi:hypothetical protein